MATIVVIGPCRHSASLIEDGHHLHEVAPGAALAAPSGDLVIAAERLLDDDTLAVLCQRPDAPPLILLLAPADSLQPERAYRNGAFDALADDAESAVMRAVVARALRYREACRARDDARADRDAVLRALQFLVDDAAHLIHDVKSPATAIRQALRAVARHLGVDQDSLLSEFAAELEGVGRLLRAVLHLVQPLPPAAAPAPLAEVFAAVRAAWSESATSSRAPLELRLESASVAVPGRVEDWVTALCGALEQSVAGRAAGPVELVGQRLAGGVSVEIRLCHDTGAPSPGLPPSRDAGVGMAFCRRMVAEHEGRLEMGVATAGAAICRIEVPSQTE